MRVIVAGIIGAAVAAAVWLGAEHMSPKDLGWLSTLVGLVTGCSVHKAAGAGAGGGYVRGGLAVILTLAAIVGGRQVYAKVMQATNQAAAAVMQPAVPNTEAAADKADDDGTEGAVENPDTEIDMTVTDTEIDMTVTDMVPGKVGNQKLPLKKGKSEIDMLWMCLAALAAYVVGKGSDAVKATAEPIEQTAEPQQGESDTEE